MFNLGVFDPDVQQAYKDHFADKGYLTLDNILTQEYINQLYETVPTLNYDFRGGVGDWYEEVPYTKPALGELLKQKVQHSMFNDDFSFFHRIAKVRRDSKYTNKHTEEFAQEINLGKVFKEWVESITGFDNLYTAYPTFSFYKYDNWITSHYDPTRKVAYLFYLTKEWKAEYGGQLCLQDEQGKVHTTILPIGNRLVLLDVSKPSFNKHFVSPVSFVAPEPRFSLVGWYSERPPKNT
jgi:Rps23 Pro-64 3,4-dihydroxylase Tpa1-like proline 4-hydroxylase